jgi:hypothetical protein
MRDQLTRPATVFVAIAGMLALASGSTGSTGSTTTETGAGSGDSTQ